jgi:polyhydroxyalkanoate synthesis regulator phasin
MTMSVNLATLLAVSLFASSSVTVLHGQSFLDEIKAEHDPAKRSEKALMFADSAFDSARDFYTKGEVHKGDAQLEDMTNALNECVQSLEEAHKARFYKKAELRVAYLQRRMKGLIDDIEMQQRGWAEYTNRKLDEIHDKLLDGVMRK